MSGARPIKRITPDAMRSNQACMQYGCDESTAKEYNPPIKPVAIQKGEHMIRKNIKTYLIISLFLISIGGFGLHFFIHNPAKQAYGYVPFISGLLSALLIPLLFCFRKTLHLAHILNGFTAIIGVITMVHFSIAKAPIYPDIAIVIAKFTLGRAIFEFEIFSDLDAAPQIKGWSLIRYPNMGFWYVHLALLSAVYALGNMLWR